MMPESILIVRSKGNSSAIRASKRRQMLERDGSLDAASKRYVTLVVVRIHVDAVTLFGR